VPRRVPGRAAGASKWSPRAADRGPRAAQDPSATGKRSFVGNWRMHATDARARRPVVWVARLMTIKRQPRVRGDVTCRHCDPWRYRRRPQAGRSAPLPSGAGRKPSQPGGGAAVTYRRWSGRRYRRAKLFGHQYIANIFDSYSQNESCCCVIARWPGLHPRDGSDLRPRSDRSCARSASWRGAQMEGSSKHRDVISNRHE